MESERLARGAPVRNRRSGGVSVPLPPVTCRAAVLASARPPQEVPTEEPPFSPLELPPEGPEMPEPLAPEIPDTVPDGLPEVPPSELPMEAGSGRKASSP